MLPPVPNEETFEALLTYIVNCQHQLQAELMQEERLNPDKVWVMNELKRLQKQLEWAYLLSFSKDELLIRQAELAQQGRRNKTLEQILLNNHNHAQTTDRCQNPSTP
jgi:hypothetical protein